MLTLRVIALFFALVVVVLHVQVAIGTSQGQVYIYDHATGTKTQVASKHKRRIVCGAWNFKNKFAFGSDDRQITICLPSGRTFDQVKIKALPRSVTVWASFVLLIDEDVARFYLICAWWSCYCCSLAAKEGTKMLSCR